MTPHCGGDLVFICVPCGFIHFSEACQLVTDPQLAFDHVSVFNNCTDTTEFEEMKKGFEVNSTCRAFLCIAMED